VRLMLKYIGGECQKIYFLNGNFQGLIYNTFKHKGDVIMTQRLKKDPGVLKTLLENGVVVQCIYSIDYSKSFFLVFINKGNGEVHCISTRDDILPTE
jgi:hypothetical protein